MSASYEQVNNLRQQILLKLETDGHTIEGGIHPDDLERIHNHEKWLMNFLHENDGVMKTSLNQLWNTIAWRKKKNINDLTSSNIRMEYIHYGSFFPHGHDTDGKPLLIFIGKAYVKGNQDLPDLKNCVLYWCERLFRESKFDQITVLFDMQNCGFSNMDMEFSKFIIDVFKSYYPNALNYILIYEMPWILSAAFKIIKQLLPAKSANKMKFVYPKNIRDFVPEEFLLTIWGGSDDYEFKFIEENSKKVTFAEMSSLSESPLKDTADFGISDYGDHTLLQILPTNSVTFSKFGNDFVGTLELKNISSNLITYKVKTTSPEKYRVRPSNGTVESGNSLKVNVILQPGHSINAVLKDKFLVMGMTLGPLLGPNWSEKDIPELWKNTPPNVEVEQHRLRCIIPQGVFGEFNKEITYSGKLEGINKNLSIKGGTPTVADVYETVNRLEIQVQALRRFQFISILLIVALAAVLIYMLKSEIKHVELNYAEIAEIIKHSLDADVSELSTLRKKID